MGLEWLKHFNKYTTPRAKGLYRILVLDGYKSHESIEFQNYCKSYNIIVLRLPPHSFHLTQLLDIGYFSILKQIYGREIEGFIKAYIYYITKVEFLTAFKTTYLRSITVQNTQAGFRGTGLIPFDPQAIISKFNIKLQTPIPTGPPSTDADPWVSQIPRNPTDALSQTNLIRNRIIYYQGNSPTLLFSTVVMLAKGTEILVYENTLLVAEVHILRVANEVLSKRRRAKKNRIR